MDKAPDNPLDGPILDPNRLPYGLRLGPMPPGAAGQMLWVNGAYLGFVPNTADVQRTLRQRVARGSVGGPTDGNEEML